MPIETRTRTALVVEQVTRYIVANELAHGDRLPGEAEMAKTLGVSRNTVRESYISLEREGWILRKHGIGTVVIRTSLTNAHYSVSRSFPRMIQESGRTVDFRHENRTYQAAPREAMVVFDLDEPCQLFCASRVICADNVPAVFHVDYFRPDIHESDFDWSRFDGDMIDLLEIMFDEKDLLYQTQITAELLNPEVAALLEVTPNTPEIVLRGVVYSHSDLKPLTCTLTYHNSEVLGFMVGGTLSGSRTVKR